MVSQCLTYKQKRVFHGDISPQQTGETREFRSRGFSLSLGYGPVATIRPTRAQKASFSNKSFYYELDESKNCLEVTRTDCASIQES